MRVHTGFTLESSRPEFAGILLQARLAGCETDRNTAGHQRARTRSRLSGYPLRTAILGFRRKGMITPVQAEAIMVMADRMEETIKQVGDSLVAALQEIKGLRALVKIQETADKDTAAFMSEHVHDKRVSRETEAMPLG